MHVSGHVESSLVCLAVQKILTGLQISLIEKQFSNIGKASEGVQGSTVQGCY